MNKNTTRDWNGVDVTHGSTQPLLLSAAPKDEQSYREDVAFVAMQGAAPPKLTLHNVTAEVTAYGTNQLVVSFSVRKDYHTMSEGAAQQLLAIDVCNLCLRNGLSLRSINGHMINQMDNHDE